ncbi:hypothetical protein MMC21_001489 [Puttea exsequens]|nr:hypothetical protein [Puttea exsequens]
MHWKPKMYFEPLPGLTHYTEEAGRPAVLNMKTEQDAANIIAKGKIRKSVCLEPAVVRSLTWHRFEDITGMKDRIFTVSYKELDINQGAYIPAASGTQEKQEGGQGGFF